MKNLICYLIIVLIFGSCVNRNFLNKKYTHFHMQKTMSEKQVLVVRSKQINHVSSTLSGVKEDSVRLPCILKSEMESKTFSNKVVKTKVKKGTIIKFVTKNPKTAIDKKVKTKGTRLCFKREKLEYNGEILAIQTFIAGLASLLFYWQALKSIAFTSGVLLFGPLGVLFSIISLVLFIMYKNKNYEGNNFLAYLGLLMGVFPLVLILTFLLILIIIAITIV